ncbi:MAG: VOC family protein [Chloroflexi bacterium]|nr:VOC family protein [Chloroflexota bacterium]
MKAEGLDHMHIAVQDLKQAVAFFSKLMGAKAGPVCESPEAGFRFQFVKAGSVVIQLMEPTSPDSPIGQFIRQRGEGLHALSFKVADLDKAIAELAAEGLHLIGKSDSGNIKQAHFSPRDTFGMMVELCEYKGKAGSIMELFKKSS